MSETKRGFKFWWPWQSDKIEAYLEGMRRRGWKVCDVNALCIGFLFERAEPGSVRICVDYQRQVAPEYKMIFRDAGWTLLYEGMGWYLWSRDFRKGDARPEIYTDKDCLLQRNRNLLLLTGAVLAMQASIAPTMHRMALEDGPMMIAVFALYAAFVLVLLYGMVRLAIGMGALAKAKRK